MRFDTVACLDDLTREAFWPAKEFIYDLIRVPIWHAAGIDIAKSPRRGQRHNLGAGFRSEDFLALCGLPRASWQQLYHRLPSAAEDYLVAALPERALVVGYEMTPALTGALDRADQPWLDLRLSPLRFGADLYLGLASNRPQLRARLLPHALGAKEVLAEACLLAAQVRYRRRYDERQPRWDDALVWIGQTAEDASLIDGDGRFVRAQDHADALRELAAQRRLHYRGHPLGGAFGERERETLRQITGQEVPVIELDTYELLAMDDDVALVGLSSGVLQEAAWFGKQALSLQRPVCEPDFDAEAADATDGGRHLHVHAHQFLSEPLWADLLGVARRDDAVQLPARANHLRELVNTWWGYATVQLRHSSFHREMLRLHGAAPAAAAKAATPELDQALQRIDALAMEVEGLKEALRVVLRQTALRQAMALRPNRGLPMHEPRHADLTGFAALGLKEPQFAGLALWRVLADYDFDHVLDVGGGAGEHAEVFAAFGKHVTSVDYGKSVYFERRDATRDVIVCDFNRLQMPRRFDLVWCSHVLEHQLDPHHFLGRLHAATTEGGVLAISVPPAKSEIVGGHVSLWNPGLLLYRLVLAGFDCRQARLRRYGYNISVLLEKRSIEVPELAFDCGDIRRLRAFLPPALPFRPNAFDDPFDGDIEALNW